MNRLARQTFAAPSCQLGKRVSVTGWALTLGSSAVLWALLFSLA